MKRSQTIMVYIVTGLMVLSALALSAIAFFQNDNSGEDVVVTDETDQETINQDNQEAVGVSGITEGVEWPTTIDEELTEIVTEDIVEGTGDEAQPGDTVTVNYRLARADGTPVPGNDTFETGQPFTSPLAGLIAGWQEGIPGMKEGGLRRLYVPSSLAYGDGDLVFDVELISTSR